MTKILYVISATILVVAFQNCAKTTFTSSQGTTYLAALGDDTPGSGSIDPTDSKTPPTTDTMPPTSETTTPPTSNNTPPPTTETTVPPTSETTAPPVSANTQPGNANNPHSEDQVNNGVENHDDSAGADSEFYLCVLKDHGKSLKLGMVQESLDGVHSVANVVCVSKAECLGDVAQHFKVETSAYERGFCEHNPNVQRLTDAEVKKLLGL